MDGRTGNKVVTPASWLESAQELYNFDSENTVSDRLAVLSQYLLPKQALTALMGKLTQAEAGGLTTAVIRRFIDRYKVNMTEAANPDPAAYKTFNAFFARALKEGARPLAQAEWICPLDGAISQFGKIEGQQIFQAKGHQYSTTALVGGDAALASAFENGSFATIYLSPMKQVVSLLIEVLYQQQICHADAKAARPAGTGPALQSTPESAQHSFRNPHATKATDTKKAAICISWPWL